MDKALNREILRLSLPSILANLTVPLVGMVVLSSIDNNYSFRWFDLLHIWVPLAVTLLAFLVHNYFIAPELVYKNNRLRYAVLSVGFFVSAPGFPSLVSFVLRGEGRVATRGVRRICRALSASAASGL